MNKSALRKEYKEKRLLLTDNLIQTYDQQILSKVKSHHFKAPAFFLTYFPIAHHKEPDTIVITNYIKNHFSGATLCYPRINEATGLMDAIAVNKYTIFHKNKYQISEPTNGEVIPPNEINLILVPLLVFNKQGYRVGYGKGYYDKYMANCNPDTIKVGLSYFPPVDIIDDTNEYDLPLNLCFTPSDVYEF